MILGLFVFALYGSSNLCTSLVYHSETKFKFNPKYFGDVLRPGKGTISMTFRPTNLRISVISVDSLDSVVLRAAYLTDEGVSRSWVVSKSFEDFDKFQKRVPDIRSDAFLTKELFNPYYIDKYLNYILGLHEELNFPYAFYEFIQIPEDIGPYPAANNAYVDAEIFTGKDDAETTNISQMRNAAVAGAIVGGVLGGPVAAIVGGATAAIASASEVRSSFVNLLNSRGQFKYIAF